MILSPKSAPHPLKQIFPANSSTMSLLQFLLLSCVLAHGVLPFAIATSGAAYPPPYGLDQSWTTTTAATVSDSASDDLVPVRLEVYGGGRIIDISHRYHSNMPSWESSDGLGNFLWLAKSMKNGSLANSSEMKLPAHTGTHVDAPGHVFDHYFDAGFDVDTLDLAVLNDICHLIKRSSLFIFNTCPRNRHTKNGLGTSNMISLRLSIPSTNSKKAKGTKVLASSGEEMKALLALLIGAIVHSTPILFLAISSCNCAYPSGYGDGSDNCVGFADGGLQPLGREPYENGEILDITHKFTPYTPVGDSTEGIGQFLTLLMSMKNGSDYNFSQMKIPVHSGSHVDAPGHMYDNYYDAGFDVDSLDLRVLNGPALLVDVPRDKNITAETMKSLNIPKGVKRVLFRTLNTDRRIMYKKEFDTSYVGFMKDGAQWLVDNTDIKLVGIDYLSVAAFDDLIPSHLVFLKSREIILVEGLKLDDVEAGIYSVHCLPLRLVGAEGSPIRCILIK